MIPNNHSDLVVPFQHDLAGIPIPERLNNPFEPTVSEIARIAALEFQAILTNEMPQGSRDPHSRKGKMYGVLVVEGTNGSLGYLAAHSGKPYAGELYGKLVPSVFDPSVDDFFIDKGMAGLNEITQRIKRSTDPGEKTRLMRERKATSLVLQRQLFENYRFVNLSGKEKNVSEIFEASPHGKPPSAAGDCAAPKLLNHAFKRGLKPVSLAEFWWGKPLDSDLRAHMAFYPACKEKCRPILEYMLEDFELYESVR